MRGDGSLLDTRGDLIAFPCLGIMPAARELPEPELTWSIRTKNKDRISAPFAETQTLDRIPGIFLPWK